MSLDYKIEAIDVWPGEATPAWQRKRSAFKTIWTRVLSHLNREIRALHGQNVVLRLQVDPLLVSRSVAVILSLKPFNE